MPANLAMSLKARAVSDPITLNGIPIGFIPDVGSDGGNVQTMVGINGLLAGRGQSYAYGFYDQTNYGTIYSGVKLLANAPDIYASGAILEASIMPVGSWGGYTQVDNSQAVAVCRVMKKFTDAGVEVRLRFAHEVNYYVTTGEYAPGNDMGVSEFKTAWAQVSSACQAIAPAVKMFYCPNAADLATYEKYLPDNFNQTVQMIGVDYYPPSNNLATAANYIQTVKPFHDKYSSSSVPFVVAEAGTHARDANITDRIAWLNVLTSDQVKSSLPNLQSITWYNALRKTDVLSNGVGGDFRILDPNNATFPNQYAENLFPEVQNAAASQSAVSVASAATATASNAASSSLPSSLQGAGYGSGSSRGNKVSFAGLAVTALAAISAFSYL